MVALSPFLEPRHVADPAWPSKAPNGKDYGADVDWVAVLALPAPRATTTSLAGIGLKEFWSRCRFWLPPNDYWVLAAEPRPTCPSKPS